jgi:hypothetical protein
MGGVFCTPKVGYYITDDPVLRRTTVRYERTMITCKTDNVKSSIIGFLQSFHPSLFENREWVALRNFCNKRGVSQKDLNTGTSDIVMKAQM